MPENRKIKVMNIIESMGNGGAQRIVLNYLEDLYNDDQIEFELYVLSKSGDSYCDKIIKERKYNVKYLNVPRSIIKIPYIKRFFNRINVKKACNKAIREYMPDIIHVHISELLMSVLEPIKKCNIPVKIDTLHSNPLRYKGKKLKVIRNAFQKEDFIAICITEEQKRVAQEYYGFKRSEVVRNGINIEEIKSKIISREEARKLYNIPNDAFVIIGVGRLFSIKRFDLLIKIVKKIKDKNEKVILIIAGDGPDEIKLKKLVKKLNIENKVRFIGNQSNIVPLYCAADVLGITSVSESASLVLLEAQICNLRCVISNGVPEESIITEKVKKMKEDASYDEWVDALCDVNYKGKKICNPEDYETHKLSQKIKEIYLKYWEEESDKKHN